MFSADFINYIISLPSVKRHLGIIQDVALTVDEMSKQLKITYFIPPGISNRQKEFLDDLDSSLEALGINLIPPDEALTPKGRIREDTAIIYPIVADTKVIAIDKVSSLYKNPIIGIFDEEAVITEKASNQEKLDTIIRCLTEEIVHLAIFLGKDSTTILTMNGGVIHYEKSAIITKILKETLIAKLTAQVVPPEILSEIIYQIGSFDTQSKAFSPIAHDLENSAKILQSEGMIMSHLKVETVNFRSKFHERIAKSYLDERSGMSYGFMVWQKPISVRKARKLNGSRNTSENEVLIDLDVGSFRIEIPDIWVVSTRSGCDKTNLDLSRDIVRLGLVEGKIIVDTPIGTTQRADCRPSYDTLAILSHALGNYLIASILKAVKGDNEFTDALEYHGLSIFHWHGYPNKYQVPKHLHFHGRNNPSVSCSTAQSAIYAIMGKLSVLNTALVEGKPYWGDVHVEPHHGTNICSTLKLSEITQFVIDHQESGLPENGKLFEDLLSNRS